MCTASVNPEGCRHMLFQLPLQWQASLVAVSHKTAVRESSVVAGMLHTWSLNA